MTNVVVFESDKWLADILVDEFAKAGCTSTWLEYPSMDTVDAVAAIAPSLITMDIVMRDMDGFQATYLLKQDVRTKDVPLVFYSNMGGQENIDRGLSLGALRYFVKSKTPPEQLVRDALTLISAD